MKREKRCWFLGSIVVSIAVCHMADRGSIPRLGVLFSFFFPLFWRNRDKGELFIERGFGRNFEIVSGFSVKKWGLICIILFKRENSLWYVIVFFSEFHSYFLMIEWLLSSFASIWKMGKGTLFRIKVRHTWRYRENSNILRILPLPFVRYISLYSLKMKKDESFWYLFSNNT